MNIHDLDLWATTHHGWLVLFDLFGAFVGFLTLLGFIWWLSRATVSFFKPELSRVVQNRINSLQEANDRRRIRKLLQSLSGANYYADDLRRFIAGWGLAILSLNISVFFVLNLVLSYIGNLPGHPYFALANMVFSLAGMFGVCPLGHEDR